jgi:hypothetical protein
VRDPELDALINAQRQTLDVEARREIGFDVQRRLAWFNAGINFVSERLIAVQWPYVRDFPLDAADGYQDRFASTWIDRFDPAFRGRS